MTPALRVGWAAVALAAAIAIPLRITEIVAAHDLEAAFCLSTAGNASLPSLAVSHANLNKGNLKDE